MVDVVTDADATWLEAPDLWEAGLPNYLGKIALATAMDAFTKVGFDAIAGHGAHQLWHVQHRIRSGHAHRGAKGYNK
ncbi:MAG: hypothetical protein Q4B54_13475 [Coriobacteriales bacterium]|nr:hypothetical protein [Coriobacteriales bacterium]